MLDSDILEVLITVRQNRAGADRNFNHPEMMERPMLGTNSDDGFDSMKEFLLNEQVNKVIDFCGFLY